MKYFESVPSSPLRAYIRKFWSLEYDPSGTSELETILPDGCPEVVFNLSDRFRRFKSHTDHEIQPSTLVAGQMTRSITIAPTGRVELFGVRFQPYGAFAFLRAPLSELTDRIEPLELLLPNVEAELRERLSRAAGFSKRIRIFETAFIDTLDEKREAPSKLACIAEQLASGRRVKSVTNEFGWTERSLERDFRKYVGLTPKMFGRVSRFSVIARSIESGRASDMLSLTLDLGYYDQAHMINEFRSFAGQSPTAFANGLHRLSTLFSGSE